MALNIKNDEADRLARELADAADETLTEAATRAVRERLERITGRRRGVGLREEVEAMRSRLEELPVRDDRSADEILGYDERGLPG
jgi:antitoxin VapB